MPRLTRGAGNFLLVIAVLAIVAGGYTAVQRGWFGIGTSNQAAPAGPVTVATGETIDPINVHVVTWWGCAGGVLANNGFSPNEDCDYYRKHNILVKFNLIDVLPNSWDAWKTGEIDILAYTAESLAPLLPILWDYDPVVFFSEDRSQGGDVILAREGINSMVDLRGRQVVYCQDAPSQSVLLHALDAANMTLDDIIPITTDDVILAGNMFEADPEIAAAAVWSPEDARIMAADPRVHVLFSTKDADHIIFDVMLVKRDWYEANFDEVVAFLEGWFGGVARIYNNPADKRKALQLMADGTGLGVDFFKDTADGFHLNTYGDNVNIFNLNGNYQGVTAKDVYEETAALYQRIDRVGNDLPLWRRISDTKALRALSHLRGPGYDATEVSRFSKAGPEKRTEREITSKPVTVNFGFDSNELDANARNIIDAEFGDQAQMFGNMYIRIVGNTDSVGDYQYNVRLSEQRAQAVADYLAARYHIDRYRFIIIGNGPNNPVANNNTDAGKTRNRRTDFELVRRD
ncbi:MAG: phosphate ABC transporter substrate-binding/OmpA family protein [Patescibacteria group bacterium]